MRRVVRVASGLLLATLSAASQAAAQGPTSQCPVLVWTTLGTAGGPVPTPERSEPANLLQAGDQAILVDTGDGTVGQLARAGKSLGPIRTVFLSHLHLDHTGGLAAVIGLRWMNQFPGQLTVYGPPGTKALVDGIVASMAAPAEIGFGLGERPPPPAGSVRAIEIADGSRVDLGPLTVGAAGNSHYAGGGLSAVSLSYRFTLGPRSITYTGDTGPSEAVARLARGSNLLVSEVIDLDRLLAEIRLRRPDASASMFEGMRRHLSTHHLTGIQIGTLAAEAGVGQILLTHFAIPPGPLSGSEAGIRSGISQQYRGPVTLARDLSTFSVKCP